MTWAHGRTKLRHSGVEHGQPGASSPGVIVGLGGGCLAGLSIVDERSPADAVGSDAGWKVSVEKRAAGDGGLRHAGIGTIRNNMASSVERGGGQTDRQTGISRNAGRTGRHALEFRRTVFRRCREGLVQCPPLDASELGLVLARRGSLEVRRQATSCSVGVNARGGWRQGWSEGSGFMPRNDAGSRGWVGQAATLAGDSGERRADDSVLRVAKRARKACLSSSRCLSAMTGKKLHGPPAESCRDFPQAARLRKCWPAESLARQAHRPAAQPRRLLETQRARGACPDRAMEGADTAAKQHGRSMMGGPLRPARRCGAAR
ncbi:hypothetical protein B0J12DRAFT_376562 [Macrophomina phaseolina]|uniref:Uncharacterized protein n=1 Tax=Macrophomina phaseolina TaxID=35725 RepID=A0ABQ8GL68_9PEZI|nr:hypothetical protein B0J12DRAFT_376562 [Macrophomina phaseolina]